MKVIHAAVSMAPSIGVVRQMEWEQAAADRLGLPWRSVLYTPKAIDSPVVLKCQSSASHRLRQYVLLRTEFFRWLEATACGVDVILLRHSVHDPFQLRALSNIGSKTFTVHHTLEVDELRGTGTWGGRFKALAEILCGRASLSRAAGIVAVTDEIADYELARTDSHTARTAAFVYPNGIMPLSGELLDERRGLPELLFVAASFAPWHGLDLLLDSMANDSEPCVLNIVGNIPAELSRRCQGDSRIRLHGLLGRKDIDQLTSSAWCGLSSLALHRNRMTEACTLKVREYLDAGLPVYADHRDSGLPADFPYFCRGRARLGDIVSFATHCRQVPKSVIRSAAAQYVDKGRLLQTLYEQLHSKLQGKAGLERKVSL